MLSPTRPDNAEPTIARHRSHGFSGGQIVVLFAAFTLLISIPVWTHPLPPLSDYVNHLARMQVLATLDKNPRLAEFYQINWQVIPNLTMDFIVPWLARAGVNIYVAGQIYMVAMFALIISGSLALNRALIGRWSTTPLFAFPLLYNYVFLVGLMNYLFGIGIALWAMAGWVALRDRAWPWRYLLSAASVPLLFFCHLSALGVYGIGILSYEVLRLWDRRGATSRDKGWPARIAEFVCGGLPFLVAAPLLWASPTLGLAGNVYWEQRGKIDGLMYVIADYSDIAAFLIVTVLGASIVWAVRHRVLRFHPLVYVLLLVAGVIYLALPRVMFDTYMTDQRVPIGVAFMIFACGDLELRRRLVRRGFMIVLIVLMAARLIEIDYNWTQLSDTTSQLRASVKRIAPGSKVFVSYSDRSMGDDVRDLGLVHAACMATIERSALVTTLFTVPGKQIVHVKPAYEDYADIHDGTPPSVAQLIVAAEQPQPGTPAFWLNWTKFDYLYVLFTEDDAPNPYPSHLKLVADGDRFQLYKIIKPGETTDRQPQYPGRYTVGAR
ncbi:hypothetical protein [Pseudolabrys sp. FHR47]|uniref:hypothetical protein n=1 Tax=Pseudolabrys sp. FHR47 TaxID=2562284 RepID=UPI0010BEF7E6|nr:hypothetical protein [Pseudolabrys sp. FHR47]